MRYEEGPTAHAEVLVDAPLDRVWELVADINLPARFSNEFRGATWIDDGPAMGARFAGRNWHKAMGERRDPALRDADGVERAPRVYDTCGALDAVRRRTRDQSVHADQAAGIVDLEPCMRRCVGPADAQQPA